MAAIQASLSRESFSLIDQEKIRRQKAEMVLTRELVLGQAKTHSTTTTTEKCGTIWNEHGRLHRFTTYIWFSEKCITDFSDLFHALFYALTLTRGLLTRERGYSAGWAWSIVFPSKIAIATITHIVPLSLIDNAVLRLLLLLVGCRICEFGALWGEIWRLYGDCKCRDRESPRPGDGHREELRSQWRL